MNSNPKNDFEAFLARAGRKARISEFHPRPFGINTKYPTGIDPNHPFGLYAVNPLGTEPELAHLLNVLVPNDGVFLDVGANVGYFSQYAAARPGFHGHVHSFEPVAETFQELQEKVHIFHREKIITCHQIAASDQPGTAKIEYHPKDPGQNRINDEIEDGEIVQKAPLDSIGFERVDFIKMDVEGHEAQALKGAEALIKAHRPFIFFEHWMTPEQPDMGFGPFRYLIDLGYDLYLPTWLQSNGTLTVGQGPLERETFALVPFSFGDRRTFPNSSWNPANIFACPASRAGTVGRTWDEALADANASLAASPKDGAALVRRARIHQFLEHPNKAIADYEQALKPAPNDRSLAMRLNLTRALERKKAGCLGEAMPYLVAAKDADPGNPALVSFCLETHLQLGDIEGALEDATTIVALLPLEYRSFVQRAGILERLKRWAAALADYDQAIQMTGVADPLFSGSIKLPMRGDLRRSRANVLAQMGRTDEARAERMNAIELMDGADKHRVRGELHLEEGRPREALESFLTAIGENPRDQLSYSFCVQARKQMGDLRGALRDASSVVALMPYDAAAFIQRGNIFASLGRRDEAIADYDEAIRLSPDRTDVRLARKAVLTTSAIISSSNLRGLVFRGLFTGKRMLRRLIRARAG